MKKRYSFLIIIFFIIFTFGTLDFPKGVISQDFNLESTYFNEKFEYSVGIPSTWFKIVDTEDYVAWLTSEAHQDGRNSHLEKGAKFAIAILDNPEKFAIEAWLNKYSGEESDILLAKEVVEIGGLPGWKYTYAKRNEPNAQSRINIYLSAKNTVFSFVVFYDGRRDGDYEKSLLDLINSFRHRDLDFASPLSLFFPKTAYAAPIPLYAPWNSGDIWIAGSGCYAGGSYYGQGGHTGLDQYAVDFNGVLDSNCRQIRPDDGESIRATNSGTVSFIGQNPNSGYGYYVLLDHGNGVTSRYAHLKYNPTLNPGIQLNQQISKGQIIGYNGSTGNSTGPHLHFVLYQNSVSVRPDPMDGKSLCDSCNGTLIKSSNNLATYVSGTISSNTTWKSGNVYVVQGAVTVNPNVTLTVEPGTIVKFDTSASISLGASSTLNAIGNPKFKIYFTSFKDDSVGGDTNGDGNATSPAPRDYVGLQFRVGSTGNLNNVILRYGGALDCWWCYGGVVKNLGGQVNIFNSQITNNSPYGIYATGGSLSVDSSIISGNGDYGVYVDTHNLASVLALTNNSFSNHNLGDGFIFAVYSPINFVNSGNTTSNSKGNGFYIYGTLSGDQVWNPGVPFVPFVFIPSGKILTISPGTIVKFNSAKIEVTGTLKAQGTNLNKIYFTSIKDDSIGGDTNGDGNATSPAPSDYVGLKFLTGSAGNLNNVILRYGGALDCGWWWCYGGVIKNLGGNVSISSVRMNDNYYGISQTGGTMTVSQSSIYRNNSYGIYNYQSSSINAQNNFWGDPSGPYHPTLNPNGKGDKVSDNVNFRPWLAADPTTPPAEPCPGC